jgi:hypothetical protein
MRFDALFEKAIRRAAAETSFRRRSQGDDIARPAALDLHQFKTTAGFLRLY